MPISRSCKNGLVTGVGNGVELISVSVDPQIDTPQRLHAWRKSFGGGRGWTLLTGKKQDVDFLLKEMQVFAADKSNHSPFILLGDEAAGKWTRVHGLTAPERLAEMITGMHDASRAAAKSTSIPLNEDHPDGASSKLPAVAAEPSPAEKYFTNIELLNQHGERLRLYADLLKGKVVVINSFFSTCKGSCPVMLSSFSRIQEHFADRVGKDLSLISITVDPQTDTPQVLAALADQWKAKPGWQFLTGDKASVDAALHKLGQRVDNKESHSNVFIIGKESTGLWKKARGLSKPEEIIPLIEEVLNGQALISSECGWNGGTAEKRQSMLTGISRIARASPRVARPALLLVGCLVIAAAISWIRFSQFGFGDSTVRRKSVGSAGGAPAANRQRGTV